MSKRGSAIPVFFFFIFLSILCYGLSLTSVGQAGIGLTELAIKPFQRSLMQVYAQTHGKVSPLDDLKQQNTELRAQLAKSQEQEKEIHALQDQFHTQSLVPQTLIPVNIVGFKTLLPGVTLPEQIVIDQGKKDGITPQSIVVYKDMLIGKVTNQTDHLSLVDLSFKKSFSITVSTAQTNALGIIKGQGQGVLMLDNVVLSENLQKDDTVITKGDTDLDGSGAPPGLVIGKIVSVDKKPSALFQTAKVQPLFDISHLSTVFVISSSK